MKLRKQKHADETGLRVAVDEGEEQKNNQAASPLLALAIVASDILAEKREKADERFYDGWSADGREVESERDAMMSSRGKGATMPFSECGSTTGTR